MLASPSLFTPNAHLEAVAEVCKMNRFISGVEFCKWHFGVAGAVEIAQALAANCGLEYISLNQNDLGDEGVKVLAEALKTNSTLTAMYVERNRIGDGGVEALAEMLKTNHTIKRVNLAHNDFGSIGGQALLESLTVNNTVDSMTIFDGSKIDYEMNQKLRSLAWRKGMQINAWTVHVHDTN